MIVPPFFGLYIPSRDRTVYALKESYLATDVLTYVIATPEATVTYLQTDVLCYNIVGESIESTWLSPDILSYNIPTTKISSTLLAVDVLTYNPPPEVPNPPYNISGLDTDAAVFLSWLTPYNNRSSITDYLIEFKRTEDSMWSLYPDSINTTTNLLVTGLVNNHDYEFRIAAINAIGTGLYGTSDIITPSGGDDSYCSLKLLLKPDSIDMFAISDLSPRDCSITNIGITSDENYFAFGGRSLFFNGQLDLVANPNQYPFFSTYNYMQATRNNSFSNIEYWSLIDNFTIEMWFRLPQIPESTQTLLSAYSQYNIDNTNTNSWKISIINNTLYFLVDLNFYDPTLETNINQSISIPISSSSLDIGTFIHFAVCRSKNYIQCFINGTETSKTYFANNIPIKNDYIIIGADHTNNNSYYDTTNIGRIYTTDPFIGNIDDILISSAAKYRKNFIPSQHSNLGNPDDCYLPGSPSNLAVIVVDGV